MINSIAFAIDQLENDRDPDAKRIASEQVSEGVEHNERKKQEREKLEKELKQEVGIMVK